MDVSEWVQEVLNAHNDMQLDGLHASSECDAYLRSLPAQAISRAADLYKRICTAEQAEALIDWLNSTEVERCEMAPYRAVWSFLLLCEVLGERGVAPFSCGKLHRFPSPPESLDWSILPVEYHYLIHLAEKYGGIQFPDQVDCFIKYATNADLTVLSQVAPRTEEDIHDLVQWIQRHSGSGRPEVDLVDFFLILLHEIGLT